MNKTLVSLLLTSLLLGCQSDEEQQTDLLYTVQKQPFVITVSAEGALEAASETVISAPTSSRGPQILAWIMPEYSHVKKGDVIARFDGTYMQRQKRFSEFDKNKVSQDIKVTDIGLVTRKSHLEQDQIIVNEEKVFAEKFSIEDERIRSKLDILDQLQNVEYLNAKEAYFDWQTEQFSTTALGEIELLKLQSKAHEDKIKMYDTNLSGLMVVAPHDGLLTHSADWRGDKPKPGQTLWSGQKIAGLPDVSTLQAKLYVHEKEAFGLKEEQSVELTLLSDRATSYQGKIKRISAYPQSISRGDPQKYYEIIASIENGAAHFKPGNKVVASLLVQDEKMALTVPKHSLINDNNETFVLVNKGQQLERTKITVGLSNLSHVEVLSGLEAGQEIALVTKQEW